MQGITALARTEKHQDARLDLELKAKRLLEQVAEHWPGALGDRRSARQEGEKVRGLRDGSEGQERGSRPVRRGGPSMTNIPSPTRVAMTVSDALDIVHELACLNQLDELATSGDASLAAHARWQQDALDRLGGLLFEHGEAIDTTLALPSRRLARRFRTGSASRCATWPIVPSNAVRGFASTLPRIPHWTRSSAARTQRCSPAAPASSGHSPSRALS